MWKLRRGRDGEFVVLTLSGRLESDGLNELQRVVAFERPGGNLAFDLKELKLVDQDAVNFLADCEARGIRLRNCPAYIREWVAKSQDQERKSAIQKILRSALENLA